MCIILNLRTFGEGFSTSLLKVYYFNSRKDEKFPYVLDFKRVQVKGKLHA